MTFTEIPRAGQRFAERFQIRSKLGSGGMGLVFRAYDEALGRDVALKIVRGGVSDYDRKRFEREGALTAALQHPGIVKVHSAGEAGGIPYLAYELLEGSSPEWEVEFSPEGRAERLVLLTKIADAVAYAHTQGVAHRDLKPENILVDLNGRPHVLDFGLAWSLGVDRLTVTGAMIGTPSYMSPEQATGTVGGRGVESDVWSLGVLLYCTLAGRLPFEGDSLVQITAQICSANPDSPRSLCADVSRDLEAVCLKCLEKDPGGRYPHAGAFVADLRRALAGDRVDARRGKVPWAALGVAAALALGAVVGVALLGNTSSPPSPAEATPPAEQPASDAPPPVATTRGPEARTLDAAEQRKHHGPAVEAMLVGLGSGAVTAERAEEVVRLAPDLGVSYFIRGFVRLQEGKVSEGLEDLARADDSGQVGEPFAGPQLHLARGRERFLFGDYEGCLPDLALAWSAPGEVVPELLRNTLPELQLRALNGLGRYSQACELAETVGAIEAATWRAHLALARSFGRSGDAVKAEGAWRRATLLSALGDKNVAPARCSLSQMEGQVQRGALEDADAALVGALSLTAPPVSPHLRALVLGEQARIALAYGDLGEASSATAKALRLSRSAPLGDRAEPDSFDEAQASLGSKAPTSVPRERARERVRRGIERVEILRLRLAVLAKLKRAGEAKREVREALREAHSPAETRALQALLER